MRYMNEYNVKDKEESKKLMKFYIVLLGVGSGIFILAILHYMYFLGLI